MIADEQSGAIIMNASTELRPCSALDTLWKFGQLSVRSSLCHIVDSILTYRSSRTLLHLP